MGKLQKGGWADEISTINKWFPNYFPDHPLVKQPKDLTERSKCAYFGSFNIHI